MKKEQFFRQVRDLDFSIKTTKETMAIIQKEARDGADVALKQLKEDEKELTVKRNAFIEGAFLSHGITYDEYNRLIVGNF